MYEMLLITDIEDSQHKDGLLEICPLGHNTILLLSPHSCQVLFELFIKWGIIDRHQLNLAIRRLEYLRG